MSKVLFISAHAPTMNYPQAGQKIAFKYLVEYTTKYEVVDVIVIANKFEIDAAKDLTAEFNNSLYTYPLSKLKKIVNCLSHYQVPLKFASRLTESAKTRIQELLKTNTYDIIHFEYSHAAVYFDLIQKYINPKQTKVIVSVHDVLTQVWLRQSADKSIIDLEVARIFQYEKRVYSSARELWVLSIKDLNILTSLFVVDSKKIVVKPPQASNFVYQVNRHSKKIEKKSLLFWAAMGRPENEQAILIFVKQCFKKLVEKDPEFKLYIVGSNPSKRVLGLASQQIVVTGYVEDPTEFFEKAEIGIVPLLEGGGVKLKTLEMLEAGLPVISTSIGAEGIVKSQDKKLVVNDDFEKWIELFITEFGNYVAAGRV